MTAAARAMYMAQPSVSQALRELEDYYGVRLFDRMGGRLHLTDTGRLFRTYASHITQLFDELEQSMKNGDQAGLLRVGASITTGNVLLPRCVEDFGRQRPGSGCRRLLTVRAAWRHVFWIIRGSGYGGRDLCTALTFCRMLFWKTRWP